MAETTAARLGGFLHALVDIFKLRGVPTAPAPDSDRGPAGAPGPAPSLPAVAGPRDIQARLIALGLLDPPADGVLGPVSRWALGEACRAAGAVFDGEVTPAVCDALARARALPLT